MKCPKCGMDYEGSECPNCKVASFFDKSRAFQTEQEFDAYMTEKEKRDKLKKANHWKTVGIACAFFAVCNILFGYFKVLFYINEDDSLLNAYVGGDAYNYIINGTYFAGYLALGGACGLASIMLLCTSSIVNSRNSFKELSNTQSHNIQ